MSTIDPGIEDRIKKDADEVDVHETARELEREERQDFEQENRWWLASVAFPLLAGTLGPMATGFNVMALSYYWRQSVPVGHTEREGTAFPDPHWVTVCWRKTLASVLLAPC